MKFLISLLLLISSIIFYSCDSAENSILTAENSNVNFSSTTKPVSNINEPDFQITKKINGSLGGQILFDTSFVNSQGNSISINTSLTFEPNSFVGIKDITLRHDPETGSIRFFPEMKFNIPAKLDLLFSGINLSKLGFDSNSKADFVYISDEGAIQYILKDECKIKWLTKTLYVKKAYLPHFSRYGFVRKSS